MKKLILLALGLCFGMVTFAQDQDEITPAAPGVTYGKTITADKAITSDELAVALAKDATYNGKVSGKVVEVCTKKGCFMKLEKADGKTVMVQFKDYGFFMPKNIVGKNVVVEGEAKVKETSVAKLQHYASDAGKSKEEIAKIKEPKRDIGIIADGVIVVN